MLLFIKLAFRNLLRNKRRTFIAGTAIGIGLASLIFTDALIIGMERNMIESATDSFVGEAQIHRSGFRQTYDVSEIIVDPASVIAQLRQDSVVSHFAPRAISFAMVTSPSNVNSVTMVGIDPPRERYLSQIDDAITLGNYFEGDNPQDVVIGAKLAELLDLALGSRIVLTVSQAKTGDLSQELFRVSGIYHLNIREMDEGMAFVRLPVAQRMLGIGDGIHEIAIRFSNINYSRNEDLPFWRQFSQNGNEAIGWPSLFPEMVAALDMSHFATYILGVILFGVVALGIINTLFMSLHERMFEFGVLRAVGTRSTGMARLILLEAAALALLSICLGAILGYAITYIVMKTGINYAGIEFSGVTFRNLLYPVLNLKQFVIYPVAVFLFTVIVAFYPAIYAARMSPAEAMRRSF
ncbi:MAG: ABC transporter permease [Candidatus Zixiibacteriota bacterium]|nr:MAG: ABC transporter permease [candidate division Zixibacteria bacterium]